MRRVPKRCGVVHRARAGQAGGAMSAKATQEALVPVNGEVVVRPMNVLQQAVQQGASVETLEKLLALQERWEANEARKAFVAALAAFKSNPPKLEKVKHV